MVVWMVVGLALCGTAAPAAMAEPIASTEQPSLGGRWKLNPLQSDDAREKVREAMAGRRGGGMGPRGGGMGGRGGGMGGGGGMGRGGGMGGRGRPDGGGPDGEPQQGLRGLMKAPEELTITLGEQEIAILEDDGRLRALHPDGKKYQAEDGGLEVKTRWDKDRLVVETARKPGPKAREVFATGKDGRQLVVTLRLEGGRLPPVTIRRVYDPVAGE